MNLAGTAGQFEDSDDDEPEPEHTAILCIGRSGSGKTTLVRAILRQFEAYKKPICLLNNRPGKKPEYIEVQWSQLTQLRRVSLVVEDVIGATDAQFKSLQEILNHALHHYKISPVLVVAHNVMKNNIFGLLGSFTLVFVTAVKANIASFRKILEYCGFEPVEKARYIKDFMSCTIPFSHFKIDIEKHTVERVKYKYDPEAEDKAEGRKSNAKSKLLASQARDAKILERAERYLTVLDRGREALAIFELMFAKLDHKCIDPDSLMISLKTRSVHKHKNKKKPIMLSIIDYIAALVDAEGRAPACADVIRLHKYVRKVRGVKLPRTFVANKYFW